MVLFKIVPFEVATSAISSSKTACFVDNTACLNSKGCNFLNCILPYR